MNFYQRPHRVLLEAQPGGPPQGGGGRSHSDYGRAVNFETNVVIVLAALLCALLCVLGINTIMRCLLQCASMMSSDATDETPPHARRKGLKKAALGQIPVVVYGSGEGVGSTDCPICLGEFLDGEKVRVLPKCCHSFHVKCVDVWLASHSSCPTCRQSLVEEQPESGGEVEVVVEVAGRQLGNASTGHGDASVIGSAEEMG